MTIKKQLRQIIGKKATRRVYKAAPWVGGAIALASVGGAIRRKSAGISDTVRDSARDKSSAE
jgi:hypothetical protein